MSHVIARLNLLAMNIIQSYCVVICLPAKILSSQARGLYPGSSGSGPGLSSDILGFGYVRGYDSGFGPLHPLAAGPPPVIG